MRPSQSRVTLFALESNVTPTTAAAPRRPTWAALLWSALVLGAGTLNVVAVLVLSSHVYTSAAGWRNEDPPFLFSQAERLWLLAWLTSWAILIPGSFIPHSTARHFAIAGLVTALAAWPTSCSVRGLPGNRYSTAFEAWASTHVKAAEIRIWLSALPPVATTTPIAQAQWPTSILALQPLEVEQLGAAGGVVLTWGQFGSWGNSRKVFVGRDATVPPPDDWAYPWSRVGDGVYAAFQITN